MEVYCGIVTLSGLWCLAYLTDMYLKVSSSQVAVLNYALCSQALSTRRLTCRLLSNFYSQCVLEYLW